MKTFPKLPINSTWVESTFRQLSLDQKIGQLLHPCIQPSASEADRIKSLGGVEPGGVFLFSGSREDFKSTTAWFQENSPIPMIVSSDLEPEFVWDDLVTEFRDIFQQLIVQSIPDFIF